MDTVSLHAGDAKPALHNTVSFTSGTKPSVIHDYKVLVKGMVGLMLRLSHEGSSPGLIQNLESAAGSLVRLLRNPFAAAVHACQSANCVGRAKLISLFLQVLLFTHTFIYSAHDAARLMKANLEHDHYEAAPASSAYEEPKQLWQGITVGGSLPPPPPPHPTPPPPPPPPPPRPFPVTTVLAYSMYALTNRKVVSGRTNTQWVGVCIQSAVRTALSQPARECVVW